MGLAVKSGRRGQCLRLPERCFSIQFLNLSDVPFLPRPCCPPSIGELGKVCYNIRQTNHPEEHCNAID